MAKNQPGQGRPTKKQANTVEKIIQLTKQGKTNEEIGEILGVSEGTIRFWIKSDYDLFTTVQELKQDADNMVKGSLFKRANGYDVIEYDDVLNLKTGQIERIEKKKHIPADYQSMKMWLINRTKDFKERVDHTLAGPDGNALELVIRDYREGKDNE